MGMLSHIRILLAQPLLHSAKSPRILAMYFSLGILALLGKDRCSSYLPSTSFKSDFLLKLSVVYVFGAITISKACRYVLTILCCFAINQFACGKTKATFHRMENLAVGSFILLSKALFG